MPFAKTPMTATTHTRIGTLRVDRRFCAFVEQELLPAIGFDPVRFWQGLEALIAEFTPQNGALLARRDELQTTIDSWHEAHPGPPSNHEGYLEFLREISYLEPEGEPFTITTENVDPEIATVAGPQLVVPVNNARFALNAANARWGSLYDALYGTDVIPEVDGRERGARYNPRRGAAVIKYAAAFLDHVLPLTSGKHSDVTAYAIEHLAGRAQCSIELANGEVTCLADEDKFVGYREAGTTLCMLFRNNGLHIELRIDPEHRIGRDAAGHVCDVVLEAALTTIQDCEDSVAAVDAEDKVAVYRNWLGLMRGTLEAEFEKGGSTRTRRLAHDRVFTATSGDNFVLSGRSLMLVRNVGHLMTTDAVLDEHGDRVFEGMLDAVVTTACALANVRQSDRLPNSRYGSIYIVKPKMHGSEEARFTAALFTCVEELFGLDRYTLKVGLMDEERRTTVNLKECIRAATERVVFINTGFLDRTGDEIHTSMRAGPVLPKETIKQQPWINAYEDWNVDVGIRCGLPGRAQIGKGMWPKPDEMQQMMATKQAHPEAGASCAWVPSPTAATLHAMHYHAVDVRRRQEELKARPPASLDAILTPPLCDPSVLDAHSIQAELDNNAQGILGYVVRWIDQGVGCSKVPDINNVGLMEDRATLRISSQHIANWLLHGVTTAVRVTETFRRMARIVDRQNASDPEYEPMSADFERSIAFQAACELVFKGCEQPNGYTEPLLHSHRRRRKSMPEASHRTQRQA